MTTESEMTLSGYPQFAVRGGEKTERERELERRTTTRKKERSEVGSWVGRGKKKRKEGDKVAREKAEHRDEETE